MAIDREYIKRKIVQVIEQFPSDAIVVREQLNKYNEKVGYSNIAKVRGILYSETNSSDKSISLQDSGMKLNTVNKTFITVFSDDSNKIMETDLLFIGGQCFKLLELDENMKVFFACTLKKENDLRLENNIIINKYNEVFELIDLNH